MDPSQKSIQWSESATELIKYQNKIYKNTFKIRQIRNFQRYILKSRPIKLLILNYILEINYIQTKMISTRVIKKKFLYFHYIEELQILINLKLLIKKSYRLYIRNQIYNALWILIYLPIQERFNSHSYLQNRLTRQNHYFIEIIFESYNKNLMNSIQFIKFPFLFSLLNPIKYWIINYILIDSKYLIHWFYNRKARSNIDSYDQVYLIRQSTLSLYNLIKSFYYSCFFFFLTYNASKNRIHYWIQFDSLILLNQSFSSPLSLQNNNNIYLYNLKQGLVLFGWFIKKKNSLLRRQISEGNIYSHQREIVTFLKNSGTYPMDKVIILLNYKIRIWKNYYLKKVFNLNLIIQLNRYLFYRIWYFLKKRHKTRGIRWIIYHYFIKHKNDPNHWIFSINQINLITYDI